MRPRSATGRLWFPKWWSKRMDLWQKTAAEMADLLAQRAVTSEEITQSCIERTDQVEPKVAALLARDAERALKLAREADGRRLRGSVKGPLDGVPIAIKDVLASKGERLTCGSRMLEAFTSPYDATVVDKLKARGAVLYGRANMDEFAMGSSTENSAFGVTRNPWALDRAPGGSSGGSAACVAAGEVPLSVGTDTGGSIRQPASLCGVVGLKPTYGLVSRFGLVAYASSLDQAGPVARTVKDAAMLLQGIAGHCPHDSTSCKVDIPNYLEAIDSDRPARIGVPCEFFGEGLDPEVKQAVESAIAFYRDAGCEIIDVSLATNDIAVPVYYIIATAEASSNLARYDGIRYTRRADNASGHIDLYHKTRGEFFGEEVKRRIVLGTYVLSSGYYDAYYLRAQKARTLIRNEFTKAFESVDAILTPTAPTTAFKIGEKTDDPLKMYLNDIYTISVNLAGLPGISLPCGFDSANLPIGMQLIGKPFGEKDLLRIARLFEKGHKFAGQTASVEGIDD